ncbi:MAG: LrgB family protein [Clostridiaceae bacterium]|nr:LrgB family protein [Clostridiaceae bacterium]
MNEILSQTSLFAIFLTLCAFELGRWLQKKTKLSVLNPILTSAIMIIVFLLITGVDNSVYQEGAKTFSWMLTPATVCLAVPLYEEVQILKKNIPAIIAGVAAGTVSSLGFIALMSWLMELDHSLYVSLLPKSITSAMAVVLSEQMGGLASITTMIIVVTGILGSVLGPIFCKIFRLNDDISAGVAYGTSAHVIGTSKAAQISELMGAVSSLSLVVAGILTALIFPLFV